MIELFGASAKSVADALAIERDREPSVRTISNGMVTLDSCIGWTSGASTQHACDGSFFNAIYESGGEATDIARSQAEPARLANVDLHLVCGKLIDIRGLYDYGTREFRGALILVTNGFRNGRPRPYRTLSTRKGLLVAMAIGGHLRFGIDEAYRMAGVEYVNAFRLAHSRPCIHVADDLVTECPPMPPLGTMRRR